MLPVASTLRLLETNHRTTTAYHPQANESIWEMKQDEREFTQEDPYSNKKENFCLILKIPTAPNPFFWIATAYADLSY